MFLVNPAFQLERNRLVVAQLPHPPRQIPSSARLLDAALQLDFAQGDPYPNRLVRADDSL
jgi:hypothetical protein